MRSHWRADLLIGKELEFAITIGLQVVVCKKLAFSVGFLPVRM
jgi:hypothetical protein